jgi:hypothetical protein
MEAALEERPLDRACSYDNRFWFCTTYFADYEAWTLIKYQ